MITLNTKAHSRKILITLVAIVAVFGMGLYLFSAANTADAQGGGGGGRGKGNGGYGSGAGTGQGTQGQNSGQGGQYANGNGQQSMFLLPPPSDEPLTEEAIEALYEGLADEYNAYYTYQGVIDQFGAVRPFTSIQNSEAHHIDILMEVFERYSIPVPDGDDLIPDDVPTFTSLTDACQTGVDAEIANMSLYDGWLDAVQDYPDVTAAFTFLRDASEFKHLPAFENCAAQ